MSWTRVLLTALAVCSLLGALLVGATGCGSGDAQEDDDEVRPSPVGEVLEDTDEEGRHYREVDEKSAPRVDVEIQPADDDGWDVRLTVRDFSFSPAGTRGAAEQGRGYALLRLDGRPLSQLRGPVHHLSGGVVSRGTHQVTVRLHADDDTVWAVDGEPVGSTADITVSDPGPTHEGRTTTGPPARPSTATGPQPSPPAATGSGLSGSEVAGPPASVTTGPAPARHGPDAGRRAARTPKDEWYGHRPRTRGQGSPDPGGKAS
ncbi:nuclear transport factor 2 family protein [Streptomyces sp. NPDC020802]|uniref:nuclear transport factor 2 family protein n=1 Tax=Streptomyces sp. NPDC020802 TaxID=3365094 RepID=UPI0037A3F7A0